MTSVMYVAGREAQWCLAEEKHFATQDENTNALKHTATEGREDDNNGGRTPWAVRLSRQSVTRPASLSATQSAKDTRTSRQITVFAGIANECRGKHLPVFLSVQSENSGRLPSP